MFTSALTGSRRRAGLLICSGLAAGVLALTPTGPGATPAQDGGPKADAAQEGTPACESAKRAVQAAKRAVRRARSELARAETPGQRRRAKRKLRRAKKRLARARARRRQACAPAAAPGALNLTGGYDHTRPGTTTVPSSVCAEGSRPNLARHGYVARLSRENPAGSGQFSPQRQIFRTLDESGKLSVSFGINQGGADAVYRIDVEVRTANGGQVTGTTGPIATPFSPQKSKDCLEPHN